MRMKALPREPRGGRPCFPVPCEWKKFLGRRIYIPFGKEKREEIGIKEAYSVIQVQLFSKELLSLFIQVGPDCLLLENDLRVFDDFFWGFLLNQTFDS